MKTSLCIIIGLTLASLAFSRDFLPEGHIENVPAMDSSIQECYIFRTKAGVRYTVQFSNDLTTWTDQDEIYGLGNEYVVTMRQFTPPPPPPPGGPPVTFPPPAKNVSLRMERSSAAEGGTVVSWASLDHGGPVVVRIAGEMVAEWVQIPLYFERFANHYFFVWHPNAVASPPAVNSILGANDSAMLAVLEASLPTMNDQVAASVAAVRNAPVPAPVPVDPDSKRFWRVKVDAEIDTDQDGSPDWAEFEIAARGTGMLVSGVTGNPFDADTNQDGISDGSQLDADLDGTPDASDPDSNDNTSVVPIGPIPRYALFEIEGNALQINDLGTVIFPTKVWKAGVLADLPGGEAGAPQASARAINDLDVILGTVGTSPDVPDHPSSVIGEICYWPGPSSSYETIHVEENGVTVDAYREHDGIYQQGPAPVLTNSGHFIAQSNVVDPPDEYWDAFDYYPTLWQIPTGTAVANRQLSKPGAIYLSSPSLMWGTLYPTPANGDQGVIYTLRRSHPSRLFRSMSFPNRCPKAARQSSPLLH